MVAETCPYLSQSDEGTGYCTLAESAVRYLTSEVEKYKRRWEATEQKLEMYERYASTQFDGLDYGPGHGDVDDSPEYHAARSGQADG